MTQMETPQIDSTRIAQASRGALSRDDIERREKVFSVSDLAVSYGGKPAIEGDALAPMASPIQPCWTARYRWIAPCLIPPYATFPVLDGRLMLGTWQSICLVDTNLDNPRRQVRLSWLPG